jgi:CoA:oxalate CoA-transferase
MLSISGFGQGGPESRRPAYAPIVHAEVGLTDRARRRNESPRNELPLSVADTNASLHGLVAVLAAVILREKTGQGQHIDMAMVDATIVTDDQLHYELEDAEDTMNLPNDVWATGAGDILVSADFRLLWRRLGEQHGLADPAGPDTALEDKIRLRREAVGAFMQALATWDAVDAAMAKMNIAWGQVRSGFRISEQPTVRHRGTVAQVDDRAGGTRPIPQSPYRFSAAEAKVRGPAPHRGEHNAAVLGDWLGLGEGAVAALGVKGVLLADPQFGG